MKSNGLRMIKLKPVSHIDIPEIKITPKKKKKKRLQSVMIVLFKGQISKQ